MRLGGRWMRQMTDFDDPYYDDLTKNLSTDRDIKNHYHNKRYDDYYDSYRDYNARGNAYTNIPNSARRNTHIQPPEVESVYHNRITRRHNEVNYRKNRSLVSLLFLVILIIISFVLLNSNLGQYAAVTLLIAILLFFGNFMSGGKDR